MLPPSFVERIKSELPPEEAENLFENLRLPSPVTVRINPLKTGDRAPDSLETKGVIPYSSLGYVLKERPVFTLDPYFQGGAYYVQEASSMSVESALRSEITHLSENGVAPRILDLCAAPGGKSTHILSLLHGVQGSLLVANETIPSRATVLSDNIARWGYSNTIVTGCDPSEFKALPSFFDIVLIDAPCSGEGMFRKDAGAVEEWSPEHVVHCAARQRRIVADSITALRPGGLLIYSTCTFNSEEDEKNVEWMMKEYGLTLLEMKRLYPGAEYGEGFFYAVLRDGGDGTGAVQRKREKDSNMPVPSRERLPFVSEGYKLYLKGTLLKAYPEASADAMLFVESRMRTLSAGCAVATMMTGKKGTEYVPHPDIALNEVYRRNSFPEYEITADEALRYFKCETFPFGMAAEKGYALFKYRGLPLGFIKNLGNRFNTLWPASRRVRMNID